VCEMKTCSKCGESKLATSEYFYTRKDNGDGLRNDCKICCHERGKKYFQENKEALNDSRKQYYEDNKKVISEYQKQYREENKDYLSVYSKKYRESNKDPLLDEREEYAASLQKLSMKQCSKCGEIYPATSDNFGIAKRNTGGLKCVCKKCSATERKIYKAKHQEQIKIQNSIYKEVNREKIRFKSQVYRDNHRIIKEEPLVKEKTCYVCKVAFLANDDTYFHKKPSGKYGLACICKGCSKKRGRQYYLDNIEEAKKRGTAYYFKNLAKTKAYSKEWHAVYDKTEKGRNVKNTAYERRRTREHNLDNNFTPEQWEQCKKDFNRTCAYCETTKKLTIEHFIPVSKLGELTSANVLPACSSCNSSKGNRDFKTWFPNQPFYSPEREQKILSYLGYHNGIQQLSLM